MIEYAILAHPGHSRVYFDNSQALFLLEFKAAANQIGAGIEAVEIKAIGGVPYITFRCTRSFSPEELPILIRLSFFYALFELGESGGKPALLPVEMAASRYFPESMSGLLKYSGKTNERFTRLMVNLALASCNTGNKGIIQLLDPLCGKGTTLYEGLIDGFDVAGVEINAAWWHETKTYIVKFLETGKYKHKVSSESVTNARSKRIADVFKLQMANNKADYDSGNVRSMRLVNGDTRLASSFFKKAAFDIVVADLPYGVQHAGKSVQGKATTVDGDLATLLEESLPGWVKIMKPGASMVLSFNEFTLKKADVISVLEENGIYVKREEPYADFQHKVDQGIKRNLVVAVKPK